MLLQPQISPLNQKHSFSENNNDLSSSRYPSLSQYLSLPLQPTEQLISSSLQSIVDDEMLHIQQTIKELIEKTNHNNAVNSNNTINNSIMFNNSKSTDTSIRNNNNDSRNDDNYNNLFLPRSISRPIIGNSSHMNATLHLSLIHI